MWLLGLREFGGISSSLFDENYRDVYFFLLYIYIIFIRGKEKVRWAGEFWCGWGCCGIGFDMLRCQFDLKA